MMLKAALTLASAGKLSIFLFHRVAPEPDELLAGVPSAAQFDGLLAHLKRRYNVMRLIDAVPRLVEGSLPARAAAITFDDGYADNLDVAAPLLARYELPATVFVATGYLDGGMMWNDRVIETIRSARGVVLDLRPLGLGLHPISTTNERRTTADALLGSLKYRDAAERERIADEILAARGTRIDSPMLTRDGVRALLRFSIDIGAHTVTHPILANSSEEDARREIVASKEELERITGRKVPLFAYPNGDPRYDYRDEHVEMVRRAGFVAAVSTAWRAAQPTSDVFQLPRFTPWTRHPLKFDWLVLRNLAGTLPVGRPGGAPPAGTVFPEPVRSSEAPG